MFLRISITTQHFNLGTRKRLFQLQIWHVSHVIPAWYLRSYQYLTNVTSWHVSNGPRFTNASYHGLTADGAVKVKREVSTWATRDVARHLHSFRYEVLRMLRVGQDGSEALANVMDRCLRCQWIRDILAILMRIPMRVSLPDDLPMESEYLGALPVGGHLRRVWQCRDSHFCKSILQERDLSPICTLRPGRGLVQFCGRSWHSVWWFGWTDWHGCVSRMYTMGLIPMCMCLSTTSPTCDLGEGNSRGNMSLCLADDSCIFRAAKPRNQSASLQRFEYSERWKDIPCHWVILKPRLPWPGALPPPKKGGLERVHRGQIVYSRFKIWKDGVLCTLGPLGCWGGPLTIVP